MKNTRLSRRHFLNRLTAVGGTALAANLAGHLGAFASEGRHVANPGIQLHTVRDLMAQSMPTTFYMLADFGYKEVEFAGYFNHQPHAINKMLSDNGLTAPSGHVSLELLAGQLDMTIAMALMVGHDYLVMPWLSPKDRETIDQYKMIAQILNIAGEKCKEADIQLCYHNHDFEFQAIDGIVPYDIITDECDADLVKLGLDLYWTKKAGIDANALFKAHPGRFPLCHVKDMSATGEMVDVGAGTIDFASQFAVGIDTGGLKHFFVEHDNPANSAVTAKNSLIGLNKLRY